MRLAVLGASFLQRDLIVKAKELGHEVHAIAWSREERVSDIVDGFHDISLRDSEAVLRKCQELRVDGVVTTSSDVAVPTLAFVADKLGLTGVSPEVAELCVHKGKMRKALHQKGCAVPRFDVFEAEPNSIDFTPPFVVKASDRSGSRGVSIVHSMAEWRAAFRTAKEESFSGDVVIEEFFEGRQFSVEMISNEGAHYFCGLTEEFFSNGEGGCEKGHLVPGRLSDALIEKVIFEVCRALDALGLQSGPSHSEIRVSESGECCIIEIGARLGGDFRNRLVRLAYGIDLDALVINQALGYSQDFPQNVEANTQAMISWVFDMDDSHRLRDASEHAFAQHYEFFKEPKHGKVPDNSGDRYGYVIASAQFPGGSQWIEQELIRNKW